MTPTPRRPIQMPVVHSQTSCARALAIGLACLLVACSTPTRQAPRDSTALPGTPETASTRALEAGADLLQRRPPVDRLNTYVDGFHFRNGAPGEQMEAHHHCSILNEEIIQCVIWDANTADAHLTGIEYIISGRLFDALPTAEKALWHSHVHEVKSGQLVAPGIPQVAENALMKRLFGTYGKTFHTWHGDAKHALPTGLPQVMMGFTADGQASEAMIRERDRRLGIDSAQRRAERADIEAPPIAKGADAWQTGNVVQIRDPGPDGTALGAPPGRPEIRAPRKRPLRSVRH